MSFNNGILSDTLGLFATDITNNPYPHRSKEHAQSFLLSISRDYTKSFSLSTPISKISDK
jgi:hypothetical protein